MDPNTVSETAALLNATNADHGHKLSPNASGPRPKAKILCTKGIVAPP